MSMATVYGSTTGVQFKHASSVCTLTFDGAASAVGTLKSDCIVDAGGHDIGASLLALESTMGTLKADASTCQTLIDNINTELVEDAKLIGTTIVTTDSITSHKEQIASNIAEIDTLSKILGQDGEKGLKGSTGAQGGKGEQGAGGETGAQGSKGQLGVVGDKGELGELGDQGATGTSYQGLKGTQGSKGTRGDDADQGDKGEIGTKGTQGVKGETGVSDKGNKGVGGDLGGTGLKGEVGEKGLAGYTGVKGEQGTTGNVGDQGTTGLKGETGVSTAGETGEKGETGAGGETGGDGSKGEAGSKGDTGAAADSVTGEGGAKGIKGEVGGDGEVGDVGDGGAQGAQGEVGDQGAVGASTDGDKGITGLKGQLGDKGTKGLLGDKGEHIVGENGNKGLMGGDGDQGEQGTYGNKGEKGDAGTDQTGVAGEQGAKGETGAKGAVGVDTAVQCSADNAQELSICSCTASTTQRSSRSCEKSYDGGLATLFRAKEPNQGTNVSYTFCDYAQNMNYHVYNAEFTYLDGMSDRTGSVTVTSSGNSGFQMIDSGLVQTRAADWGEHSRVMGSTVTLTASGGNPWQDGANFGAKSVKFYGCPFTAPVCTSTIATSCANPGNGHYENPYTGAPDVHTGVCIRYCGTYVPGAY